MNLPPSGSGTDVTTQIQQSHLRYGASDNTNARGLSSSKALNYAHGASIQRPIIDRVTVLPYTLNYTDSVGLFGVENCFVRVDLDLQDFSGGCFEEEGWNCAVIHPGDHPETYYDQALINGDLDLEELNTYIPAQINNRIMLSLNTGMISIDLINNKTGNRYVDDWLDVRIYTKNYQEHAYDRLYVGLQDYFYVGFHARNTRQLPYDVSVRIGDVVTTTTEMPRSERRYLTLGQQGNLACANQAY